MTAKGEGFALPPRPREGHKGDFGKIFILGGSVGYTGAPVFAARGAVRAGAGLVFLAVPEEIYPIVAVKCDEAMPFPLPTEYEKILEKASRCDAAVLGPGLGRSERTDRLVLDLMRDLDIPVVLDADGLSALAGHLEILDRRGALTVLTPHEGEFQRLTGCALPISDRTGAARDFAVGHRCVLVLKGQGTVTADWTGKTWVNDTGNPGMAKGGSGDVLAGIVAAFLAQKHLGALKDPGYWTANAVWCHGGAGDRCAKKLGEYGMTPSDLLGELPLVLRDMEENGKT
jgi:NAD(P)H-hydrate epimerase